MKKVLLFVMMCVTIGCSQSKYGQGGDNACQFVKEQTSGQSADINTIEVIHEDSLLSDAGLTIADVTLAKSCAEFKQGKMSKEAFTAVIDSLSNAATDVYYSWKYSIVANDSLKKLPKYGHLWRKVYTVKVTMKSGVTKEPRVLMDNDGVTPRMLEKDIEKTLDEFTKKVLEAQELSWTY